jgi:hypothetical protein
MIIYNSTTGQLERYQVGAWGAFGGVSDHGQLTGLGDDDHPQYLFADGSRNAAKLIITDGANHYLQVPQLTTIQRDGLTPINGMIIYNSTTTQFERYQAGAWAAFGGPPGDSVIVQVVNYQTGEFATGTTLIPIDDTIPQNNEGDQYMPKGGDPDITITPQSGSSKLKIDVVWMGHSTPAGSNIVVALFQDNIADALKAGWGQSSVSNDIHFTHWMNSPGTGIYKFKVRAGCGATGTTTFNGAAGNRYLGGVMGSSITITEIAV